MASGLTFAEKRHILQNSVFPMLLGEMHRLVEIMCPLHGRPEVGGPNFAATMLCLVACEVLGRLTSSAALSDDQATVAFIRSLADSSGDARYRDVATTLVVFFRNGIVHSFRPKGRLPIQRRVEWPVLANGDGICIESLAAQPAQVAYLRENHHLVVRTEGETKYLVVVPHMLYLDILGAMMSMNQALSEESTAQWLDAGFERW